MFKLNQHVNIAVQPKIIPNHGPKERQPPDMMFPAETVELVGRQKRIQVHKIIIACENKKRSSLIGWGRRERFSHSSSSRFDLQAGNIYLHIQLCSHSDGNNGIIE